MVRERKWTAWKVILGDPDPRGESQGKTYTTVGFGLSAEEAVDNVRLHLCIRPEGYWPLLGVEQVPGGDDARERLGEFNA